MSDDYICVKSQEPLIDYFIGGRQFFFRNIFDTILIQSTEIFTINLFTFLFI